VDSPKGDITGATVYDAYLAERHEDIMEYCKADVIATREVYRRMTDGAL